MEGLKSFFYWDVQPNTPEQETEQETFWLVLNERFLNTE